MTWVRFSAQSGRVDQLDVVLSELRIRGQDRTGNRSSIACAISNRSMQGPRFEIGQHVFGQRRVEIFGDPDRSPGAA